MKWFNKKKSVINEHVKGYKEGRRLMRQGDGVDEFIGMDLARTNLLALTRLGYDTDGNKASIEERMEILRKHGLTRDALLLEQSEHFS